MEPSQVWQIIILIILLILSGFFSMSETALMALSKIRIRHMVEDGVKGAKLVEKLTEDPNKLLGAILIGNNIVKSQSGDSDSCNDLGATVGKVVLP